jgi:hypothetical protein
MTSRKPVLWVSFSLADHALKHKLDPHLHSLGRFSGIEVWTTDRVQAGDDWRREVGAALERADVALLLISADYLASNFLQDVEVPRLFQRRAEGGLRVVPALIRACYWEVIPWLRDLVMLPKSGEPIDSLPAGGQDRAWTEIVKEIAAIPTTAEPAPAERAAPLTSGMN